MGDAGAGLESLLPVRSRARDVMEPRAPGPPLPPLAAAAALIGVAGAAALANCAVLAGLLRRSRNGVFQIITQLAVADLFLAASITPEVWTSNAGNWDFGSRVCTAYQGVSVLASTASTYFVAALALHVLATVNVEEKALQRRNKRNCQEDDDEIRSSQHSLVANSDSSTPPRTMHVDYRVVNTRVPVTLPIIFVWTLSASLSVPEFALAAALPLPPGKDTTVCTLDSSHLLYIHSLLTIFVLLLPLFIMCTASVLLLIKFNSKLLNCDNSELVEAIKLSLCLIVVFCVFGAPRVFMQAYSVYWASTNSGGVSTEQNNTIPVLNLTFSGIYLTSTLIHPLLYVTFLPRLRNIFSVYKNNLDNV